jgi:hypothetical protein
LSNYVDLPIIPAGAAGATGATGLTGPQGPPGVNASSGANVYYVGAGLPYTTIQSALTAIGAATTRAMNETPQVVFVDGGVYDEDLTIPSGRLITMVGLGTVVLGDGLGANWSSGNTRNISWSPLAADIYGGSSIRAALSFTNINHSDATSTFFTHSGCWRISGALTVVADATYTLNLTSVELFGALSGTGTGLGAYLTYRSIFKSTITATACILSRSEDSQFNGLMTLFGYNAILNSEILAGMTVTANQNTLPPSGIFFSTLSGTFTSPALGIKLDDVSDYFFVANGATLGGSASKVYLQNVRAVSQGGTGAATLTLNSVLLGNGTSAPQMIAPGASGNVLKSDGTTWASGTPPGDANFASAVNSSAPNATVPTVSLSPTNAATNVDFTFTPKGTGSILAQTPDSLTTGGNKRGAAAIDLQLSRSANTQVSSGASSTIGGGKNNTASNTGSTVVGGTGNVASDTNATVGGNGSTASNTSSVAIGDSCLANGFKAVALGAIATASGTGAVAIGNNVTSSANGAFCCNTNNIADGANSFSSGEFSKVFGIYGKKVHASGNHGVNGDAQLGILIVRAATTSATPVIMTSGTTGQNAASATNQLILQNNNAINFCIKVSAKQSASTNMAAWKIEGAIVRGTTAATTAIVGTPTVTTITNIPAWSVPALTADTTNGGLALTITGPAATNIRWTASIEVVETIYA